MASNVTRGLHRILIVVSIGIGLLLGIPSAKIQQYDAIEEIGRAEEEAITAQLFAERYSESGRMDQRCAANAAATAEVKRAKADRLNDEFSSTWQVYVIQIGRVGGVLYLGGLFILLTAKWISAGFRPPAASQPPSPDPK